MALAYGMEEEPSQERLEALAEGMAALPDVAPVLLRSFLEAEARVIAGERR